MHSSNFALVALFVTLAACGDPEYEPLPREGRAPGLTSISKWSPTQSDFIYTEENEISPEHQVPYFSQWSNELHPGASAANTSIAMVLACLGWTGSPDDITRDWGREYAWEPENLGYLFNVLATDFSLRGALQTTTAGDLAGLRKTVDEGYVVIIHGYFSPGGHVVVITGRTESGDYIVNDPGGRWSEEFKGEYEINFEAGRRIIYDQGDFETAVATLNGRRLVPLRYHILRQF